MERLRYPGRALSPDYARVAVGLTATLGPLAWLDLATVSATSLGGLALLFAWFGARTVLRQLSWVELSRQAIVVGGPLGRRLPWDQLGRIKLAYYAPRRARDRGWLQLTLRGQGGRAIRIESTLEGFDQVLDCAVGVAAAKALTLDPTTRANLSALGREIAPAARDEPVAVVAASKSPS